MMAAYGPRLPTPLALQDRKSTRLNSSHLVISYAVFCLRKKTRLKSSHLVISYAVLFLKKKFSRFNHRLTIFSIVRILTSANIYLSTSLHDFQPHSDST